MSLPTASVIVILAATLTILSVQPAHAPGLDCPVYPTNAPVSDNHDTNDAGGQGGRDPR